MNLVSLRSDPRFLNIRLQSARWSDSAPLKCMEEFLEKFCHFHRPSLPPPSLSFWVTDQIMVSVFSSRSQLFCVKFYPRGDVFSFRATGNFIRPSEKPPSGIKVRPRVPHILARWSFIFVTRTKLEKCSLSVPDAHGILDLTIGQMVFE